MSSEEYITALVLNLGDVEALELIHLVDNPKDPPPFKRGEFSSSEVLDWVSRNQDFIVPSLLRIVDLSDEAVAYLHRLGVLPTEQTWEGNIQITFSELVGPSEYIDSWNEQTFSLTDLAVASAALCELFVEVSAANHSFGLTLTPPAISLERGSLQFTVGGGLLASGVGLTIACGAGLVIAPIGFIGGGVLASAGLIDLVLGWKKAVTENRKLRSEAHKLDCEALKLTAEARKLELEAKDMEDKRHKDEKYQYKRFAHSKLIPREVVLREAQSLGLSEGYANHILNRSLQKYGLIKQRLYHVTKKSK